MSLVIRVTDFAAPELDVYARTTENQLVCREDPENGKFIAETPMVIERALDAGYVPISFLRKNTLRIKGKPLWSAARTSRSTRRSCLSCKI